MFAGRRDDFGAVRSLDGRGSERDLARRRSRDLGGVRRLLPDPPARCVRLPAPPGAGDWVLAEDLTQEVWLALVEELRRGRWERADIRWLITVARSRFIDAARRERRRQSKLELIRREPPSDIEPTSGDVLDRLDQLLPMHRAVLVPRYVDGLSVPEIATAIGRNLTATNSLLARARSELRRESGDANDG
ncbi:MAG TPA: sigma-70 family RNA polymerase sigma factor [Acidimicrobiales bacterium]|nr:sigma-70 family RNA polymerase sigma factor [Acidimicrobiales bacterium]